MSKHTEKEKIFLKKFYSLFDEINQICYYSEILDGYCENYKDKYHEFGRIRILIKPLLEKCILSKKLLNDIDELI